MLTRERALLSGDTSMAGLLFKQRLPMTPPAGIGGKRSLAIGFDV